MNTKGSLLERLRQQLADLESNQRRRGGPATAGFWTTPSPDAAEAAPEATDPPSTAAAGSGREDAAGSGREDAAGCGSPERHGSAAPEPEGSRPSREFPEPLTIHWGNCSKVGGAYASGFAFAAASLDRPQMEPDRMSEPDLLESVTQLGAVQHHREGNLVRLVTQLEARGVASPGGLSRVDWLRRVDPTLTASAAKAVMTCAAAFNQPRWALLREAVTGESAQTKPDGADGSADATNAAGGTYGAGGTDPTGTDGPDGSGGGGASPAPHAERVTVGKAAQVIDFHTRLKPVADPDDLDQAVAHLTEQAAGLRWEQLGQLARELADQVRPPKDADEHDQRRREGRGLWFTGPNAAGMVGMTGTLDPEGAATLKAAIDPLSAPCPLTDEAGVRIEDDPRQPHQRRMDALLDLRCV
ncbi:MAG: 13E12 repeat family protein [Humibacillus sp.]|nr:13E12 repeat family protein [Humibacillus sp.]MDN5777380.1 13E12 repeat family protein [Humibacillus sp.]